MAFLETRAPDGRPWTLVEWIQGKPIGVATHSMFVHFPVAFYLAVIAFDVMSRITPSPGLVLTGTYLLIGAGAATVIAASLGLVDWFGMISGSSKKRLATQHMILQLLAASFFVVAFIMRWPNRGLAEARTSWIVVEVVGYLVLIVGQHLGGLLVYSRGMRVRTGGGIEAS